MKERIRRTITPAGYVQYLIVREDKRKIDWNEDEMKLENRNIIYRSLVDAMTISDDEVERMLISGNQFGEVEILFHSMYHTSRVLTILDR